MNDSENKEKSLTNESESSTDQGDSSDNEKITPARCFSGSAISGALGFVTYLLSKSIVMTYSTMPLNFNNAMAVRIASTVRTLVMGLTIMATFLFIMVTIGLIALGVKLLLEGDQAEQT